MKRKVDAQQQPKDPVKQAAGRARAKKALRIDGKFVSNQFTEKVKADAERQGVKDFLRFFQQNEKKYSKLFNQVDISVSRNSDQIISDLEKFKGTIKIRGKKVKKGDAIKEVASFAQYMKAEHEVVAIWLQPETKVFGNEINIPLPEIEEFEEEEDEGEELEEKAERLNISIIRSNRKAVRIGEKIKVTKYDATRGTHETYEKVKVDRRKKQARNNRKK